MTRPTTVQPVGRHRCSGVPHRRLRERDRSGDEYVHLASRNPGTPVVGAPHLGGSHDQDHHAAGLGPTRHVPSVPGIRHPGQVAQQKEPRPGLSKTLVPEGPTFLTICRYAGLDQKVKAGTLERSRVVTGAELAAFVKYVDEPTWQTVNPHTTYMCPMSIGLVDLLEFVYPSGSPVVVSVDLDGCPFVSNGYRTVWGGSLGARISSFVGSDTLPPG